MKKHLRLSVAAFSALALALAGCEVEENGVDDDPVIDEPTNDLDDDPAMDDDDDDLDDDV